MRSEPDERRAEARRQIAAVPIRAGISLVIILFIAWLSTHVRKLNIAEHDQQCMGSIALILCISVTVVCACLDPLVLHMYASGESPESKNNIKECAKEYGKTGTKLIPTSADVIKRARENKLEREKKEFHETVAKIVERLESGEGSTCCVEIPVQFADAICQLLTKKKFKVRADGVYPGYTTWYCTMHIEAIAAEPDDEVET